MTKKSINDLLHYDLKIVQNDNFFKFSLDSVMLAEFIKVDIKDKRLLDLCTGNAPIPLIISKSNINIYGIEIQPEVYDLAQESVKINGIKNINLINDNIKNIENYFPGNNFDIITCNPPYFKYDDNSILSDSKIKAIARHEVEITLEEVIKIAYNNLRNMGKFYLVYRTERIIEIVDLFNKYRFGIKRMRMVHYDNNSLCSMILIEAKKNSKNYVQIMNPLFVSDFGRNK